MPIFGISFAGHHIRIKHDSDKVEAFLNYLFADLSGDSSEDAEIVLSIGGRNDTNTYHVSLGGEQLFEGYLGVKAAAVLYDVVIFHLLNHNSNGLALHSGAVSCRGRCILLPGVSGAGKSSVAAYLTANGFSYATDELVYFHAPAMDNFISFTRPICLKASTVKVLAKNNREFLNNGIMDDDGAIIPHRCLNPDYIDQRQTPELILFPFYKKNAVTRIEKLSGAQASTRLMTCCANARNLKGHGFKEIVSLARLRPVYQLTYGSFSGLETAVKQLLRTLAVCRL